MKRLPAGQLNTRIHRERDLSALSRLALLLFCGLALTCGFLFAAKQHFAAIQYGYKSQDLRREHERLVQEQRRLLLMKEEATSPVRLEPAARGLGLQPVKPGQIAVRADDKRNETRPAAAVKSAASSPRSTSH
jgi:cell division protein FtsL